MGIIVAKCPHCLADGVVFRTIGGQIYHRNVTNRAAEELWMAAGAICPRCSKPIAVIMLPDGYTTAEGFNYRCDTFLSANCGSEDSSLIASHIWPFPPKPEIPAYVPPAVERAMLQAERNYPVAGNEEAASIMYRRTLELAFKGKFPALTGSLAGVIKKLVVDRTLPEAMGDWANEIRDLGNNAAHDPGEIDRDQLRMIRGFTDATLRYLYTLPAEVDARRKLP